MSAQHRFASYDDAIDWLYGTQLFGIKLGLENVTRLLDSLDALNPDASILHVAGTNGKGSVCVMADALVRASGKRCGLFTSPHLVSFRERMRVDGEPISKLEILNRLQHIKDLVSEWDPHPTFFELTLAVAMSWFCDVGAEIIILETGMGGRLDATNAPRATVSAITPIALDHQKWLGNSLEEIAREKAGILKTGIPAMSSAQEKSAETVLRNAALTVGAPLHFVDQQLLSELQDVNPGIEGPHQRANAALALAAVRLLGLDPAPKTVSSALRNVRWRARFERFREGRIIVDGAHNPQAISALVATWREAFGDKKCLLLFGSVEDKEAADMLQRLSSIAHHISYVRVHSPRAMAPSDLANLHPDESIPFSCHESIQDIALPASNSNEHVLIAGSLFLAGEAIALLDGMPRFEQSSQ